MDMSLGIRSFRIKREGMSMRSSMLLGLFLILLLAPFSLCENSEKDAREEFFHQNLTLIKSDSQVVEISVKDLYRQRPNLDPTKDLVVIHVQNTVISRGESKLPHLIDVTSFVVDEKHEDQSVDIRDVIIDDDENGDIILHYIIYDLCNLGNSSTIMLEIDALDGEFEGFVSGELVDFAPFSIQCIAEESETFVPREQHGSCNTWDGTIWVFGGKRSVDKDEEVLDDIMSFDSKLKSWRTVKPSTRSRPGARFGHVQFCYYNYIIVFGGQAEDGNVLGDLWVFDIAKEQWRFIMDTEDTFEIGRKGVSGWVPAPRMFAASVINTEIGAGYISGGMLKTGVACDIWGLRLNWIISYLEDDEKSPITNFWVQRETDAEKEGFLCRYGHSAAVLNPNNFLIYGGLDHNRSPHEHSVRFNTLNNDIDVLEVDKITNPDIPETRLRAGTLSTGNGMVILYGGVHPKNEGYYTDLWHIIVSGRKISFHRVEYTSKQTELFMNWRHGFTMHYVRNIQDPILVGGTYGNNQQAKVLVTLPEKKCKSEEEFHKGQCSPCPWGSTLQWDKCKYCGHSQYFQPAFDDYFDSMCLDCQRGLVGGGYGGCVPCEGGYIYDMTDHDFCKQCDEDKLCPIGTKYEFPAEGLVSEFDQIKVESLPEFNDPHHMQFDKSATVIIFLCVACTLILFIIVTVILSICKEKALFVFREMDKTFVTGGRSKSVVGGIIMCFFILVSLIISSGFIINYFAFNSRITSTESKNPSLNRALPASYLFNITFYTSQFIESEDPFEASVENFQNISHKPMPDLCKHDIHFFTEQYFAQGRSHTNFECNRKQLSNYTDEYNISLLIKHIEDKTPKESYVRFKMDSPYNQVVHFFKWEYWSIWKFYEHMPIAYSKISGFVTPQTMSKQNKNITAAFKGPESTKIFYKLVPTHYGNEDDGQNYEGYQVFVEDYWKGSTVNKRNMANHLLADGNVSAGFDLELISSVGDTVIHIEANKIRSVIEIIAYVFGFIAGFVIVSHLLKYFLSKEEYFKGLERECNTLFGSLEGSTMEKMAYNRPEANSEREMREISYSHDNQVTQRNNAPQPSESQA